MKPLCDSIVSHHAQPPASTIDWSEFITLIQTNDTLCCLIQSHEAEQKEAARKAKEDAKKAEEAARKAKAAARKASIPPPAPSTKDTDIGSVSSGSSSRSPPTSGSIQSSGVSKSNDNVMIIDPVVSISFFMLRLMVNSDLQSDPCVYCILHKLACIHPSSDRACRLCSRRHQACKRPDATPKAPSKVILKLTTKKTGSRDSESSQSVKRPRTESSATIGPGTSRSKVSSTTTPSIPHLEDLRSFKDRASDFRLGLTYMMDAFDTMMGQHVEEMDEDEVDDLFDDLTDVKGKGKVK
ncbi:hypothetical protein JAAARDRAFT_195125 [Jaapia argillacea MUCL 33604]|uniref:Uncharacterized protein n=1 Tax=Jaapia argillacea MUCL 33604 TaxID=933084 RepID=A0A067PRP1_9AGAM|nr:hypothetical protein JAAARDRAFT_195125 [Jaapia argillacea MUCL 33604]